MKRELCKTAFTLAETMVTLIVVGIITAATLPVMITNHTQRVNSERHADIVYKMANAMHMMKAQGALYGKFDTTMDFVNSLKKYIKIDKICDSDHIADCWGTKKVTARTGASYDVSLAKTRADIMGNKTNKGSTPNVGVVLADGTHMIMTYDPDEEGLTMGDKTEYVSGLLPVGKGVEEYKNYTNNAMRGLAFVFDINGGSGPNKEKLNLVEGVYKDALDIRSFNGAHFIADGDPLSPDPCSKFETYSPRVAVNGTCYFAGGRMNWNKATGTYHASRNPNSEKYECPNGATNETASKSRAALETLICTTIKGAGGTSFSNLKYWTSELSADSPYYASDVRFYIDGHCASYTYDIGSTLLVLCSGK